MASAREIARLAKRNPEKTHWEVVGGTDPVSRIIEALTRK